MLLLTTACAGAWDETVRTGTVEGYLAFAEENADAPTAAESKARAGDLMFYRLGADPSQAKLRDFIKRFPDAIHAQWAQCRLSSLELDGYVTSQNLGALTALAGSAPHESLRARAKATEDYLRTAAEAIRTLDPKPLDSYVQSNPAGELSADGRRWLEWIARTQQPRSKVLVSVDPRLDKTFSAALLKRFGEAGVKVQVSPLADWSALSPGQIGYSFIQLQPGREFQVFKNGSATFARLRSPVAGVGVMGLAREKEGLVPLFFVSTLEEKGRDAPEPQYPVLDRNPWNAVLTSTDVRAPLAQLAKLSSGRIAATVGANVDFYDVALLHHPRAAWRYPSAGTKRKVADIRLNLVASGSLVARYGEGLEIIDSSDLENLKVNDFADFAAVGQVHTAVFLGDRLFFSATKGTYEHRLEWDAPRKVGDGAYTHLGAVGQHLVGSYVGSIDAAIDILLPKPGYLDQVRVVSLESTSSFTFDEPPTFVRSVADGADLLLVTSDGDVARLVGLESIERAAMGSGDVIALQLTPEQKHLLTAGPRGVSLLSRKGNAFRSRSLVAIQGGCSDLTIEMPFAHVACGSKLLTLHLGVLEATAPEGPQLR